MLIINCVLHFATKLFLLGLCSSELSVAATKDSGFKQLGFDNGNLYGLIFDQN